MSVTKRINFVLFLFSMFVFTMQANCLAETCELTQEEVLKTRTESYCGVMQLNNRNYVYFAQNSPEWSEAHVGGSSTRVGQTMCSAFSISNVLINMVPYESLPMLNSIAKSPIRIDTNNIVQNKGYNYKAKFKIEDNSDFFRYFPLCITNYANGNNKICCGNSKNMAYYPDLLKLFGIQYEKTKDLDKIINCLRNGGMVVTCTGGCSSPISQKSGHYYVLASIDDEYIYALDSMYRESYRYDKKHLIEILEPGAIRFRISDIKKMALTGIKFCIYPTGDVSYSEADYEKIIARSNSLIRVNE